MIGEAGARGGTLIIRISWAGTASLAVVSLAGLVALDRFAPLVAVLALVLFASGCGAFLLAYWLAVVRSRTEQVTVTALYLLAGSAPRQVRLSLLGSFAVQCLVALAAVALRPFSSLVYTSLAPVFGLGLAGLWSARHGSFPSKVVPRQPPGEVAG